MRLPGRGRGVLVVDRNHHAHRSVPTLAVAELVARVQHDGLGLAGGLERMAWEDPHSKLLENTSAAALSKHDPIYPID